MKNKVIKLQELLSRIFNKYDYQNIKYFRKKKIKCYFINIFANFKYELIVLFSVLIIFEEKMCKSVILSEDTSIFKYG